MPAHWPDHNAEQQSATNRDRNNNDSRRAGAVAFLLLHGCDLEVRKFAVISLLLSALV